MFGRRTTADLDWGGGEKGRNLRFLLTSGINSLVTRLTELPAATLRLSVRPFVETITDHNTGQHVPQVC
jgi:hypothetical protein